MGEDVVQLDVEAVRRETGRLRDPVSLFEAEDELVAEILSRVELLEAKDEGGRLL